MRYRSIYLLSVILVALMPAGCQEKLPQDELPDFVQRIVINGVLSNDSSIRVEISTSGSPYDVDIRPEIITNASVVLEVNDQEVPINYDEVSEKYVSPTRVNAGDKVYISVSHSRVLSALATVYMPPKLATYNTTLVPNGGKDINNLTSDRLDIKIKDDGLARNYYNVRFFYFNELSQEYLPFDFPVTNPSLLAASTFKLDDGTYVIKDDLFNGNYNTISVVPPLGLVTDNTDIKYLVQVISLSEDYWHYLVSRDLYDEQIGLFNDAVVVQSNITGGLGILGTQLVESDTIR